MHDQREQCDHRDDAEETQFLGDHREQEVGMRLRQVEQLLDAAAETDAEQLAAAEGDQRVRELVTAPEGIGPRIHEAEDAVAPVRRDDDHHRERGEQQRDEDHEQARAHAAEDEDAHGDRDDDDEGAEVGLLEQQHADQDHRHRHRHEGLLQVGHVRHLAHRVVGSVEDREELHQLGRLQVGEAERQPALRAIDFAPDPGDQHQREEDDADQEQPGRDLLPGLQGHLEGGEGGEQAEAEEDRVADEEIGRLLCGEASGFGDRDRRRVHHHQAEDEQEHAAPEERVIDLGLRVRHAHDHARPSPAAAASARTAAMKTSARCA